MNGQQWLEGGYEYHMSLNVPSLIIHGRHDKFISLEEEQEMKQVSADQVVPGQTYILHVKTHNALQKCGEQP